MWVVFNVLWFTNLYFCLSTEQQSFLILAAIGHPNEKTDFLSFWPCHPLQYSCLENPTDKGAWWATVHGVAKSGTRLSDCTHACTHTHARAHTHTHTHTHTCLWDLNFLTRDWTYAWQWKCWVLTTEPPGNSQGWLSFVYGCTNSDFFLLFPF